VERSINRKTSLFRVDFLRRRAGVATPTVQLCRADARAGRRRASTALDGTDRLEDIARRRKFAYWPYQLVNRLLRRVMHGAWKSTPRTKHGFSINFS
jgi:hypothetical protein